jgi:hypothetical protein
MGLTTPEVALIKGHRDPRMLFRYSHPMWQGVPKVIDRAPPSYDNRKRNCSRAITSITGFVNRPRQTSPFQPSPSLAHGVWDRRWETDPFTGNRG